MLTSKDISKKLTRQTLSLKDKNLQEDTCVRPWEDPLYMSLRQRADDISMLEITVESRIDAMSSEWSSYTKKDTDELRAAWSRLKQALGVQQ